MNRTETLRSYYKPTKQATDASPNHHCARDAVGLPQLTFFCASADFYARGITSSQIRTNDLISSPRHNTPTTAPHFFKNHLSLFLSSATAPLLS